ncbi:RNA polymerase sigma factor [Patescibacteria group bacterium]|nr:MAG: RNA polymerase sigma factor [Patescibacteria group bacterium]
MADTQEQFLRAYEKHADALFRYCFFKVSDRETAKDLLQETFTRTWLYISQGGHIINIKSFLYRTLNNLIIDTYRKKKSQSLEELSEQGFDYSAEPNQRERVENHLDGTQAIKMIRQLPPKYREVLFMRYVQELSLKEISSITKMSVNSVSVQVHRAIEKVKKIFNHE